jgi:hypothetical protein
VHVGLWADRGRFARISGRRSLDGWVVGRRAACPRWCEAVGDDGDIHEYGDDDNHGDDDEVTLA